MEKYKNEAERQAAFLKASVKIREFLKEHISYAELLERHARAQIAVADMMTMLDEKRRQEVSIDDLYEFFYFTLETVKLLEPFADEKLYI